MSGISTLNQSPVEKTERRASRLAAMKYRASLFEKKTEGIQDKALSGWTFEKAEDTSTIQIAKQYVEHWPEVRENNLGLLLWGDVGTGKSFTAACIANALQATGVPVLMTNFSKILNKTGGLYSEERYKYIASFASYDLLIIDDLGIERNTEYAMEQVYAVIDERYKSGMPLIVTTNLTISEIREPEDTAHARIYSRVLEMCTPVQVRGIDRRDEIGRSKQELVRNLLCCN